MFHCWFNGLQHIYIWIILNGTLDVSNDVFCFFYFTVVGFNLLSWISKLLLSLEESSCGSSCTLHAAAVTKFPTSYTADCFYSWLLTSGLVVFFGIESTGVNTASKELSSNLLVLSTLLLLLYFLERLLSSFQVIHLGIN